MQVPADQQALAFPVERVPEGLVLRCLRLWDSQLQVRGLAISLLRRGCRPVVSELRLVRRRMLALSAHRCLRRDLPMPERVPLPCRPVVWELSMPGNRCLVLWEDRCRQVVSVQEPFQEPRTDLEFREALKAKAEFLKVHNRHREPPSSPPSRL